MNTDIATPLITKILEVAAWRRNFAELNRRRQKAAVGIACARMRVVLALLAVEVGA
jgi:hypothetical protein